MALTASWTSPDSPSIDRTAAERMLSARLLNNVVHAGYYTNGRGVQEGYADGESISEVRILQHEGISATSRTIGANGTPNNNTYFNKKDEQLPAHNAFTLQLDEVFDRVQLIPQLMEDVLKSVTILNVHSQRIEQRVRQLMNAYTMAKQIAAILNYEADAGDGSHLLTYDDSSEIITNKFFQATAQLNDGDPDNYIDSFSLQGRLSLWSTYGQSEFYKGDKNVFELGSSRGVELLEIGSAGTLQGGQINTEVNGYFGNLSQTPMHFVSGAVLNLVDDYLGQSGTIKDNFVGMLASAEGTARGYGVQRSTKMVDALQGQGVILQPLVRWGVEVFYPKSIVIIMKTGFVNPSETTPLAVLGTEDVA